MTEVLENSKAPAPPGNVSGPPAVSPDGSPSWRWNDWIALFGILLAFLIFTKLTWAHWGDVRQDCGVGLYVAQELAHEKMLYRDLWFPYGPVAPYLDAILFKIFGENLLVVYFEGLAVTLGVGLTLYAIARQFTSRIVALMLVLCFFAEAFQSKIFSFILPYSDAATISLLLALLCHYFLIRYARTSSRRTLAAASVMAGVTLLTKTEYGIACYLIIAVFQVGRSFSVRSWRALLQGMPIIVGGLLIPLAGYGYFIAKLSLGFFLRDAFSHKFYVWWAEKTGFRFVPIEVMHSFAYALLTLLGWTLLACIMRFCLFSNGRKSLIWVSLSVGLVWALYFKWGAFFPLLLHYVVLPPGIFWLTLAVLFGLIWKWYLEGFAFNRLPLIVLLSGSLALSLRVMADVELRDYSVYYNVELILVFLMVLATISGYWGQKLTPHSRSLLVAIIMVLQGAGLVFSIRHWATTPPALLVTDRGYIYTGYDEATLYPKIIRFMREKTREGSTVLVVPQETSLYFFAGITAPSRWYTIHPYLLDPEWKEQAYIADLEKNHVEYILFSNLVHGAYGLPFFGLDYDQDVYHWIQKNYVVIGEFGKFSRADPWDFGMLIYRRR